MNDRKTGKTHPKGCVKGSLQEVLYGKRTERLTEILIRCKIKQQCFGEPDGRIFAMRIGAADFQPYIYNTNYVSGNSLGRVSAVGDPLTSKTDYSELLDESLNENPLRKGETSNFMDILQMQLYTGRMNASRVLKACRGGGWYPDAG